MTDTLSLYDPVAADLDEVQRCLLASAEGQHPLLAQALTYVFETRGKRLRPALVLLSGLLGDYDLDRLVLLAASLEVVHTASLVHDDTIDEAFTRRGLTTLNALWDRHTAIVTGDYLFAKSAELAARMDDVRIMRMLSETVMAMCSGELRQYETAYRWNIEIDDYLNRIGAKTASLFAMCCAGAAVASRQPESRVEALRSYGYNLGLAFQIVDDILDFTGAEEDLGKPAGSDLRHGTITLPALLFWKRLETDAPLSVRLSQPENAELALDLVRGSGVLEEARAYAYTMGRRASEAISLFPSTDATRALFEVSDYVPRRAK